MYDDFEDYLESQGYDIDVYREIQALSTDWKEQRKANKRSPEQIHEQGLEFVERENYDGGAYDLLVAKALDTAEENKLFDYVYEVKSIKRDLIENYGFTYKEVKNMFKFAECSGSVIKREMILEHPELEQCMRLRKCGISQFYRGTRIEELEQSAALNVEEGGDFAA